ncbi:uncharacterized protein VTP21DRAFT_2245 [Calcarisporiella thermophila]|uniref:uncharacterized protein n=1 Tax=Calcarisporiella thermophila TaxID=911321 RepID=UPI0037438014
MTDPSPPADLPSHNHKRISTTEPPGHPSTQKRPHLEGTIQKRAPIRSHTLPTDIYVSRKSSFHAHLDRARKLLLSDGEKVVIIHGMGAAINKAITLALAVRDKMADQVEIRCRTSTVMLVDDVEPEDMDEDLMTQERNNSAVHIELSLKEGAEKIVAMSLPAEIEKRQHRHPR